MEAVTSGGGSGFLCFCVEEGSGVIQTMKDHLLILFDTCVVVCSCHKEGNQQNITAYSRSCDGREICAAYEVKDLSIT